MQVENMFNAVELNITCTEGCDASKVDTLLSDRLFHLAPYNSQHMRFWHIMKGSGESAQMCRLTKALMLAYEKYRYR